MIAKTPYNLPRILIIDDEKAMCPSLKKLLQKHNFKVSTANSAKEGLNFIQRNSFDLILCDIVMPDMSGLVFLSKIAGRIPVIMMTAYASIETTRKAFKIGAQDYLIKPFNFDELLVVIEQNIHTGYGNENPLYDSFLQSKNLMFQEIIYQAEKFAPTDISILILGESGTGKEVLTDYIHLESKRKNLPLIKINCAAIPESLLESELFGYEKGAFTGAYSQKIGKFEEANGGTIFFDEICDMSLNLQAKLLRVLQDFKFYRLGGHEEITSNTRIITASNKDLEALIQKGKFRVDLFHRLNVITLKVPPLRERTDDIEDLSLFFLRNFSRQYSKNIERFTSDTMDYLINYNWPGNIRELKNCIERAVVICESSAISPEHLPDSIKSGSNSTKKNAPIYSLPEQIEFYRTNYMRELILTTLKKTDGNRTKTAQLLKISRKTLYNRMKELNIKYEFS
jgi:DNA-binding NtrC family response regulator